MRYVNPFLELAIDHVPIFTLEIECKGKLMLGQGR